MIFSGSLVTKGMPLNNKSCMIRPTLIDINPIRLSCYPLIISPGKYKGSYSVDDILSTGTCVTSKINDVNVVIFNMISRIYEAKTLVKLFLSGCKCNFGNTTGNAMWSYHMYL